MKLLIASASMEGGGAAMIEEKGKNSNEQVEARNDDGGEGECSALGFEESCNGRVALHIVLNPWIGGLQASNQGAMFDPNPNLYSILLRGRL